MSRGLGDVYKRQVFLMYEIVAGKPAPEKFMEYAQVVGMLILLALVVYANGNDIIKLF